jgi:folate-binding protein YgfZ
VIHAFWVEVPRDVVRVAGPDAVSYLQGQVSQDVEGLAVGSSAWSFVLQPQGKVDAWFRMTRTGDDELVLDVDGGYGGVLVERLERFKLRTKADFERLEDWRCVAVRGLPSPDSAGESARGGPLMVQIGWGVDGFDVLGVDPRPAGDVPEGTLADYEALRIECGVPRMGSELTERTIPAEAGKAVIDRSVSFTKGCYTGQELVARIDSRGGNVPRHLRGLILDGDVPPEPGEPVVVGGAEVGVVTSAARSTNLDALVALAYVKRDVEVPTGGEVGGRVARIETLPLLRSGA